jgi:hypothetical protein
MKHTQSTENVYMNNYRGSLFETTENLINLSDPCSITIHVSVDHFMSMFIIAPIVKPRKTV